MQSYLMINMSTQRTNPVRASGHSNLSFIPSTNLRHLLPHKVKLQYQQKDETKGTKETFLN
jgi:hypothetical protein